MLVTAAITRWKNPYKKNTLKPLLRFLRTHADSSYSSYARRLRACVKKKSLFDGKIVHSQIVISAKFETLDIYTRNNLVTMYAKCGSMVDARKVFDQMTQRDVVTWTAVIAGYVKQADFKEALEMFYGMREAGENPNQFTFTSILPAITGLRAIEEGRKIHEDIIRAKLEGDPFVGSGLVAMYAKCGSLEDARQVFDKMPQRDVVLWNVMIEGCVCCGAGDEALRLFYRMRDAGVEPDEITFTSVIRSCGELGTLQEVHEEVRRRGFECNVIIGNTLVDMYVKIGSFEVARQVFDKMPRRDASSWNTMIRGYVENERLDEALELFGSMPDRDVVACNAMIAGYAQNGILDQAWKLFCEMPSKDVVSWNAMIAACIKHGQYGEALTLFHEMKESNIRPNQFTFASILPAFANLRNLELAKKIHEEIDRAGFQFDVFVETALVDMYAKCKSVENAYAVFDKMPERDVVTWTAMIAGYAQNGEDEDALKLFREMQIGGLKPDSEIFTVVIPACANMAALKKGREVHGVVIRSDFWSNVFVGTSLVDMYSKCGSIDCARNVFDNLPHRSMVSWNAMIVGYAMHGFGTEALRLFDQMQRSGLNPDHVTLVGVLSACCHSGLVDEGWHYFERMKRDYLVTPTMQHYSCMVDLLGRAGCLVDAQDFINKMPIIPDANVWNCLLGACKLHTNVELGELAAEHLFELDPENPAPYVLLSNIYAQDGRWDDIEKVRKLMKDRGVLKKPGCSWIEVNKRVHGFVVGGK